MKKTIENIFTSTYDFNDWKQVLNTLFTSTEFYATPINTIDKTLAKHNIVKSINEFGNARLADGKLIRFYDVELEKGKSVSKNRVGLRNLIHTEINPGDTDALFAVYHNPDDKDWRLTFISKSIYWDENFSEQKEETHPKRFTYVLGVDETVKTAVSQFDSLTDKKITLESLIEAFSVEKLNKAFFKQYQSQYVKFWEYLANNEAYRKILLDTNKTKKEEQEKPIRDFTKKLLGRVVFLYFLQKKGWMGCSANSKKWEGGEKQFLQKLFENFEDQKHFHSQCLTELFFNTLNRKTEVFKYTGTRVPYLNGGLFEPDEPKATANIDFPVSYFKELFDFFGQYNFTIDENSPDDHEVGIDPEMLGHIFENLLEDNKDKGTFYTPKEIVQYMTQESLIQYLQTHLGQHEEVERFVRFGDKGDEQAKHNFIRDNATKIEDLLDKVKICDPAIGSGAFPMGMLYEIFKAKMALDWTLDRATVKKNIIQNSIYGVDLESGAIDIARLRFWLALVVDEEEPQPLPNLDYKIMQGNSLLESFEGIDLSTLHEGKSYDVKVIDTQINIFSGQEKKKVSQSLNFEQIEDLTKAYFSADTPEEKKELHQKIDKHILNHIHFTLEEHKAQLQKEAKKISKSIDTKVASLRTGEQKIKYQEESKEGKKLKEIQNQLNEITHKEIELFRLTQSSDRPFFLWHLFFKEVFDNGGFDIVIGNPPYVDIKGLPVDMVKLLFKIFETPQNRMNLYAVFVEQGLNLCKEDGLLSYIIPNSILLNSSYSKIRKKLVNGIHSIIKLPDSVFVNAIVETITFTAFKKPINKNVLGAFYRNNDKINFNNLKFNSFKREDWVNDSDVKFNVFVSPEIAEILNQISLNKEQLIDYFDFSLGITPYDKYQGHSKELIENRGFHSKEKKDENYVPLIGGKNIHRFIVLNEIEEYLNYGEWLGAQRQKKFFTKPRVVVRQIASGNPPKIYAAYTEEELYHTQIGFSIIPKENIESISLKILCALLNSRLINFYHRYKFLDIEKNTFQKVLIENCKRLPIPISFKSNVAETIDSIFDYIYYLLKHNVVSIGMKDANISTEHLFQFFEDLVDGVIYELFFEEHMKDREINIIDFVVKEIPSIKELELPEKITTILKVYQNLRKSEVNTRMKLFVVKSPEILKPIIQS